LAESEVTTGKCQFSGRSSLPDVSCASLRLSFMRIVVRRLQTMPALLLSRRSAFLRTRYGTDKRRKDDELAFFVEKAEWRAEHPSYYGETELRGKVVNFLKQIAR
jgi:hypothetical protein